MKDARGLEVSTSDSRALDAYERGLQALRSYRGDPLAALDEAISLSPGFAAAHAVKALGLMTLFERRFARDALAVLDNGAEAIAKGLPRERALAQAARFLAEGDWARGAQALDRVLVDHPTDIAAIQVGHLVDFVRGDNVNLRNRISRVLPYWSDSIPGYSFVVGMHSFGLEECNQYAEAELAARRALAAASEDCWATHALTHVFEMQARIEEGIDFLQSTRNDWAPADNGFAFHNWWHLALFHMDRGEFDAALKLYDEVLAGAMATALPRLDATALLWRLELEGVVVGNRFEGVADAWQGDLDAEGGYYAFNDFHAALAFAATGRNAPIKQLREKLAASTRESGSNAEMAREVGIDVSEAAIAFRERRYAEAAERLVAVREGAWRFGGSHAQRDILTLTLVEAARRAGKKRLAAHYANERRVHKPQSEWGLRITRRVEATASMPEAA